MAALGGAGMINLRRCDVSGGTPCSTSVPWGASTQRPIESSSSGTQQRGQARRPGSGTSKEHS